MVDKHQVQQTVVADDGLLPEPQMADHPREAHHGRDELFVQVIGGLQVMARL